jgi:flagellar basal body-associated protein FliL
MGSSPSKTRTITTELLNTATSESLLEVLQDCNTDVNARQAGEVICSPNDGFTATTALERRPNESNRACLQSMQSILSNIRFTFANAKERGDDLVNGTLPVEEMGADGNVVTVQRPYAEVTAANIRKLYTGAIVDNCKSCVMSDIDMSLVNTFEKSCDVDAEFVSKVQNRMVAKIEQLAKNDDDVLAGIVVIIPTGKQESETIKTFVENNVTNRIDQKILQDLSAAVQQTQEVNIDGADTVNRGISQNQAVNVITSALTKAATFQSTINTVDFVAVQSAIRTRDTTGELADSAAAIAKAASRALSGPLAIIFIVIGVLGLIAIVVLVTLISKKKRKQKKLLEEGKLVRKSPPALTYEPLPPPRGVLVPDGQKRVITEEQVKLGPTGRLVDAQTGYPVKQRKQKLTTNQITAILVASLAAVVVVFVASALISTSAGSGPLNSSNSSAGGTAGSSNASSEGSSEGLGGS